MRHCKSIAVLAPPFLKILKNRSETGWSGPHGPSPPEGKAPLLPPDTSSSSIKGVRVTNMLIHDHSIGSGAAASCHMDEAYHVK